MIFVVLSCCQIKKKNQVLSHLSTDHKPQHWMGTYETEEEEVRVLSGPEQWGHIFMDTIQWHIPLLFCHSSTEAQESKTPRDVITIYFSSSCSDCIMTLLEIKSVLNPFSVSVWNHKLLDRGIMTTSLSKHPAFQVSWTFFTIKPKKRKKKWTFVQGLTSFVVFFYFGELKAKRRIKVEM